MQQHIKSVRKPSRLFITQPQVSLVHSMRRKNKQQSFSHQIYTHVQRINKKDWILMIPANFAFVQPWFLLLNFVFPLFLFNFWSWLTAPIFFACVPLLYLKIRVNGSIGYAYSKLENYRLQSDKSLTQNLFYQCSGNAITMAITFALFQTCFNSFITMFFCPFCKLIGTTSFPWNLSFWLPTIMHIF